ncbi:hypothetical protein EJB05_43412, partial [Eragrostis curvula]
MPLAVLDTTARHQNPPLRRSAPVAAGSIPITFPAAGSVPTTLRVGTTPKLPFAHVDLCRCLSSKACSEEVAGAIGFPAGSPSRRRPLAVRGSFNAFDAEDTAQANAASGIHSEEASTCSNDYDDIARTSLARSMQIDIVNALRRDAPDPLFVMETLELMESKGVGISKNIYKSVIQALSSGGYLKEALHCLTLLMEKENNHGTLPFFNIFLNACGSTADLNDVECCLEKMETHLLGKCEITYCELLKVAVLQRNLSAVHDIWKECARYYSPSIITQRKFLRALTMLGDLQSACHMLQRMVALAADKCDDLRVTHKRRYRASRLDIPVPALSELEGLKLLSDSKLPLSQEKLAAREIDVRPELFQEETKSLENVHVRACVFSAGHNHVDMVNQDSGSVANTLESSSVAIRNVLRWSFNDIMHACVRCNNCQLAEQLFLEMRELGLRPSRYTYDGFVKTLIAGKGIAYAIKVIEAMESRGIEPYNDTLAALSVANIKKLHLDLAEDFLERISEIQQKHIRAFNALLVGCQIKNEPERAVRILAKMKRVNMKPNRKTYELLFCLFGNVNDPYEEGNVLSHVDVSKRINIIESDMLSNEIRHSFIRAFGAEGMIEEMLRYLNVAENVLWNMYPYQKSDLYCIVLHALVNAKETHKAIRTFKIMRSCGLPSNVAVYNTMIECCKLLPCLKSSYALISLMLRDGFCPTVVTFTSLLKVFLAKEDFLGALDLLDMCKLEGIQPDVELFNTILSHAYYRGQIHVIEYVVECMHRAEIQPDPTTLWCAFCAYTEQELYNTAIEALQVLSLRMISKDVSILSEKGIVLEDLIFSEEPDAELRIVRSFEAGKEYLATGLLNLKWCATMGATISWSPEESLWARRLASSYDANKRPYIYREVCA